MSPITKKNIKQRLILGLLLFICAVLFVWTDDTLPEIDFAMTYNVTGTTENPQANPAIIGLTDVEFSPANILPAVPPVTIPSTIPDRTRLLNFDYIVNNFFNVARNRAGQPMTALLPTDIDSAAFIAADLSIDRSLPGPHVLIFHAHSWEHFIDSDPADPITGIMGVGQYLANILNNHYNISTMHITERFDIVGGHYQILGAYERLEPVIRQILADNPSIQVIIDLHRDGFRDNSPPLIYYVDGVRTAQLMFFNGLSRQFRGDQLVPVPGLPNPYLRENLNFSFQLQMHATEIFPGLMRRIFVREFRYSLHMLPLSTLVEVGNQYNTLTEAQNAMYPLAQLIYMVVGGSQ